MARLEPKRIGIAVVDHLFLFRVPLLAPVWTVFLYGALLGRRSEASLSTGHLVPALVAFSFLVGGIYILNQIFDIESDKLNNKLFLLPQRIVRLSTAWIIALLSLSVPLVIAFFFSLPLGIVFGLSALVGFFYNCRPLELKNRPYGGLLANMLGHGFLTFSAGWLSTAKADSLMIVPALAVSLANGAVYLISTVLDAGGDGQTGKRTFAVQQGERATSIAALALVAACLALSFWVVPHRFILLATAALSLPFYIALIFRPGRTALFNAMKIPVFVFTLCLVPLAPWYGALIALTFLGSRLYYQKRFGKRYPAFGAE